jgi:cytidyltransferase-like protein
MNGPLLYEDVVRGKSRIVVASGHFTVLHEGHINYLEAARSLGDCLVVVINSDLQVVLKQTIPCLNQWERLRLVRALRCVDWATIAIDKDRSVCETLRSLWPRPHVFANGGDVTVENCREEEVCRSLNIETVYGVGGGKVRSSSEILAAVRGHEPPHTSN